MKPGDLLLAAELDPAKASQFLGKYGFKDPAGADRVAQGSAGPDRVPRGPLRRSQPAGRRAQAARRRAVSRPRDAIARDRAAPVLEWHVVEYQQIGRAHV